MKQLVEAQIESLVNLQIHSISTEKIGDSGMRTWSPPPESGVSLGDSKPITFIRDRLIASNAFKTDDIEIFTSLEPLGESRVLNFSTHWPEIESLLLKDKTPLMVKVKDRDSKIEGSQSEYQLRVLRVKDVNGQKKLYHVDMLQGDNEMALENKIITRFLSFGNLDLDAAQKSYLKPIIAAAQNRLLPPLKTK